MLEVVRHLLLLPRLLEHAYEPDLPHCVIAYAAGIVVVELVDWVEAAELDSPAETIEQPLQDYLQKKNGYRLTSVVDDDVVVVVVYVAYWLLVVVAMPLMSQDAIDVEVRRCRC